LEKLDPPSAKQMTLSTTMDRWRIPGGFKVLDANGQSLAYVYARETKDAANIAGVLTEDEAMPLHLTAK
jgi:hypothetical protein